MRLLLLLLLLTACNASTRTPSSPPAEAASEAMTTPDEVDVVEFNSVWQTGEGVFLDVRTPEEFSAGHVPGAVLLPVAELSADLSKAEAWRDQTVYVYCRTSNRSGVASKLLREAGFEHVVQVRGGYSQWAAHGFTSER